MLKALSTLVVCLSVAGCVDAKQSFNDFAGRVVDANTNLPDRPNFTTIPDVTGQFLLSAHPAGVPDNLIMEFISDYTMTANADGTATLAFTVTALKTADRTLSTMAQPIMASGVQVRLDGTFDAPLQGTLPGDANPVIPGSSAQINAVVHGEIHSTDFLCGTLTGKAGALGLDGSTFAAQRITPGTIGSALPPAIVQCPTSGGGDAGVDAAPDAI